ncbi:hypothetical protein ACFXB3_08040, partial [Streptomyces sp. NPDC059447]
MPTTAVAAALSLAIITAVPATAVPATGPAAARLAAAVRPVAAAVGAEPSFRPGSPSGPAPAASAEAARPDRPAGGERLAAEAAGAEL